MNTTYQCLIQHPTYSIKPRNWNLLVYFIGYILSIKTLPYQGHHNSEDFQNIIARLLIKKGKGWTRKDLQYIYQERQVLVEERISEDFLESAKSISLQPVRPARISVWTPVTESQCSITVRTTHRTWTTESSYLLPVRMAQQTQTIESICLQGCPDAKVKTADGELFPAIVWTLGQAVWTPFSKTWSSCCPSGRHRLEIWICIEL
jgi:hypothetical protein